MIHSKESKPTDSHGVICETTKMATSDFGICDFQRADYTFSGGSFSFKPTNSSDEIKCSEVVQAGFLDIKIRNFHGLYINGQKFCNTQISIGPIHFFLHQSGENISEYF